MDDGEWKRTDDTTLTDILNEAESKISDPSAIRHRPSAIVLGGGVAGIAAAVRLAEAGVPVTLVEMRPRLGGRATSLEVPGSGGSGGGGLQLDNCQHV